MHSPEENQRPVAGVGGRSRAATPRSIRLTLLAAFVIVVAGLVSATALPLVGVGPQVRELIDLGDDHAEAIEILAKLHGRLSSVRAALVRVATDAPVRPGESISQIFRDARGISAELQKFADTPTEKEGLEDLRAQLERCSAGASHVEEQVASGRGRAALAEIPRVLGDIAAADEITERLVTYNANQVQASAHDLRRSLWLSAAASAVLAALGFGAALVLLRYARAGFARYSASIETRAEEMAAFAGRAAHELRSPLQTIALAIAALRADPSRTNAVDRAEAGVRRLRSTIEELLEFAISGATPHPSASCAVAPVVDELMSDLAANLSRAAIVVERDVEPALRVRMDAAHLRAVVSNLVTNAVKHGCRGAPGRIRISAARCGDGWAEISVADDGPGIPTDALPRVFEPLFRASSAEGHGIGLATTKRLVEAHGGVIAIDSAADRGTTVRTRLPAAGL